MHPSPRRLLAAAALALVVGIGLIATRERSESGSENDGPDAAPRVLGGEDLVTGFTDAEAFQRGGRDRRASLRRARAAGATIVRVTVNWSDIAPLPPPDSARGSDPDWGGYRWSSLDPVLGDVVAAGLTPLVSFARAPPWAEGAGRPPATPPGTWRPRPAAYRDFAEAVSLRFSGRFRVTNTAPRLPRVRLWQAWNEPNMTLFLSPQRTPDGAPASPRHYRLLLNAFYRGVKAASPGNLVVSAGTAPFGDLDPGGARMPPAQFVRELLCLESEAGCEDPARFDVLAHHVYGTGAPERPARNADDVLIPDLERLRRPLRRAEEAGTALPRAPKPLWITEIGWDSSPPDPQGVPVRRQARYLARALRLLSEQSVEAVVWSQLRDEPADPSYAASLQSGVYLRGARVQGDRPKPSLSAFRRASQGH